jgi:hypothetical protein
MSKNKEIINKQSAEWKHIVVKESGSRGTYFDMPDEETKFGTGHAEILYRSMGYNNLADKKHWKINSRPYGSRRDIGTTISNLGRMKVTMNSGHTESKFTPEQIMLNKQWFDTILTPEVRKMQELRGNPTVKKQRKTVETITNELSHFNENKEDLISHVKLANKGILDNTPKESQEQMLDILCKTAIADRVNKLEALKKK